MATQFAAPKGLADVPTVKWPPTEFHAIPTWLTQLYQEHGPVFRLVSDIPFGLDPHNQQREFVYMIGPEANQFILHTHRDHFSHHLGWSPVVGPLLGKGLLTMDGAEHAAHRKMMNPAFTVAYMNRYLPIMQRVIRERTANWVQRGKVNLYEETRKITFDVAAEALVGFPTGRQVDRLRELFYALFHGLDAEHETREQFMLRMVMMQRDLNLILLEEIARRRQQPTDDILGFLVQAHDEDGQPLSDVQLLGHVNVLLVAGHETTTTLSAWLLYELGRHPDYLARVRAELDQALGGEREFSLDTLRGARFLGWLIDETGRIHPPVRNAPRGVVKEFEFAGYTIPAGAQIRYSIAATHLLPHIWREPLRFDPDRFAPPREEQKRYPLAHLPFGAGPRICIGMHFAQVEVKAMVAHILRTCDLTPVAEPPVEYGFITAIPAGRMSVRVTPRS